MLSCRNIKSGIVACLAIALLFGGASGQDNFVPISPSQISQYHINFERLFFASPEAEKRERAQLYAALKSLEDLKGKITDSAANLERALQLNDRVQIELNRHYSYLYLRNAVNTRDEASLANASQLDAEVTTRTAFLRQELMQLGDRQLATLVAHRPSLKLYLFAIESARRYRPHTLSLKEEELLSATAPNNEWQSELYQKLIASGVNSAGSADREKAFKERYANRSAARDVYAFTLTRLASMRTRLARLRHFDGAASEVYFNSYWTKAEVDDLITQVAQHADLYKRYQRLRAAHVAKLAGLQSVNVWDLSRTSPAMKPPQFTIEQASDAIRQALKPLGTEYGTELAALLDPPNGRMDIVPGPFRKRGGFSQGFIGTDSVFFSSGFKGSYNDVRILAHESTHALHRQLMNRQHVLPAYAAGPHYLFEAFAIFSEFLLPDFLYSNESDPLKKQFYLEQFLEGKGTVMFVAAPEVALEHAVYEGVEKGTIKGADDLDALTRRIYAQYSIWAEKHDELKAQWMDITLMYEDPFYDVNYVSGALLALNFYEMYRRDRKSFVSNYIELMRNGFDAPPEVLLQRFLKIDLHDPRLISNAVKVIEEKVQLLEQSYRAN
ncbi:MAG TPA: M3 family metallopeptidase [Pyrinomonadaceae bacterium]